MFKLSHIKNFAPGASHEAGGDNTVLMNTPSGGPGGDIKIPAEVYMIGIGGIGMSAIAKYYQEAGAKVSGYDKTPTALTKELEAAGIPVHYEEMPDLIPRTAELVVYTPAIPEGHAELVFCRNYGFTVLKRSEVLHQITTGSFTVCVAGTHGKTTITSMIAHVLRHSGYGCHAFLGGIAVNYGTNYWSSSNNVYVVEADEYDRSFLKLFPNVAVISAMDPDHLDIYGTAAEMEDAFISFSRNIKENGLLVKQYGLKRGKELNAPQCLTYSLQNESADVYASGIRMQQGTYIFDVVLPGDRLGNLTLNMGGMHNVENTVAAIAVSVSLGIEREKIADAVQSFRGVKRRFETIIQNDRLVFIDDYAHHPEELKALINGAKTLYHNRKCTVVFQPHLYTRTRDLADGFAAALDHADEVVLLPIYPARELPLESVSSEMILGKMKLEKKAVRSAADLLQWIEKDFAKTLNTEFGEILITAGAGDIDILTEPVRQILKKI